MQEESAAVAREKWLAFPVPFSDLVRSTKSGPKEVLRAKLKSQG